MYLGVQVGRIEVDVIEVLALDRGMKDMFGTRTEVSAMQVAEYSRRAHERGLVRAIPTVDRLLSLKEEQARPRTCEMEYSSADVR